MRRYMRRRHSLPTISSSKPQLEKSVELAPTEEAVFKPLEGDLVDAYVARVLNKLDIKPGDFLVKRLAAAKYLFGSGPKAVRLRVVNNSIMVRVGGGWITLEAYIHNTYFDRSVHDGQVVWSLRAKKSRQEAGGGAQDAAEAEELLREDVVEIPLSSQQELAIVEQTVSDVVAGDANENAKVPQHQRRRSSLHDSISTGARAGVAAGVTGRDASELKKRVLAHALAARRKGHNKHPSENSGGGSAGGDVSAGDGRQESMNPYGAPLPDVVEKH